MSLKKCRLAQGLMNTCKLVGVQSTVHAYKYLYHKCMGKFDIVNVDYKAGNMVHPWIYTLIATIVIHCSFSGQYRFLPTLTYI